MDYSIRSIINNNSNENENKLEPLLNISDFSIDHILNRAGEKFYGTNNSNVCVNLPGNSNSAANNSSLNLIDKLTFNQLSYHQQQLINGENSPMFDWLQYTRYKPPRLPRPLRQGPVKRTPGRLPRVPFTPSQLSALENAYKISTYLSSEDANKLAMQLDLTNTRVKIWFQNRRARERREKRERGESPDILTPISSPERELSSP